MRRPIRAAALLAATTVMTAGARADVIRPPANADCAIDARVEAAARAGQNGFQRLDRLPPAALYLTVVRTVDRCPAPVIVSPVVGVTAAPH